MESVINHLASFLGYMTPHFPFTPTGQRDIDIEQAFQELNLIYCELSSLLLLKESDSSRKQDKKKAKSSAAASAGLSAVREYTLDLLGGEGTGMRKLTPQAYTSLLPTIWALISSSPQGSMEMFQALVTHSTSVSSKAALKRPTVEFVGRIILVRHFFGGSIIS